MKYHISIQAEAAGAIAERENPASESVGYLVEDTFEAENMEEATRIAKEWTAKRILSSLRDPVAVMIEEIETGRQDQINVPLPPLKSMIEAEKDPQL